MKTKLDELCPYCGAEVEFYADCETFWQIIDGEYPPYELPKCEQCGEEILPCSLCYADNVPCSNCPFKKYRRDTP